MELTILDRKFHTKVLLGLIQQGKQLNAIQYAAFLLACTTWLLSSLMLFCMDTNEFEEALATIALVSDKFYFSLSKVNILFADIKFAVKYFRAYYLFYCDSKGRKNNV